MVPQVASIDSIERIRNLGIIAHIDAGKTTTTERMLYYTGVTSRMGEVDQGASTMDWMPLEQERGITINAASTSFSWHGHTCNLIDLPGHVDFTVEVERCMRVLDGAVAIFCAVSGVESQSETVWRQADRYGVPRIAFINKCDRPHADPAAVAEEIRQRLSANPIVLQLPHRLEEGWGSVVDLVHFRARTWDDESQGLVYEDTDVPSDLRDEAILARNVMLEALAEVDDSVMAKYLADTEITPDDIKQAIRRATLAMRAVPVVMGAALKNRGVQSLLDAIVDYLPSPVDLPPAIGTHPDTGAPVTRQVDGPASALAFKVMNTRQLGQVTYLRVYSGQLRCGDDLLNPRQGQTERLERLVKVHAEHLSFVDELSAGDIGGAVRLAATATGDTLCDPTDPVVFEEMSFPEPVISTVLEVETDQDREGLLTGLRSLTREDPSCRFTVDAVAGTVELAGMGELHLDILVERLAREFGVRARMGRPQVAYLEAPTREAQVEARHILQTGPPGAYGHVRLAIAPLPRGSGLELVVGPDCELPNAFKSAALGGVAEALDRGYLAGYPVTDARLTLLGGTTHPVDSTERSFKIAGLKAGRAALEAAALDLLEPLVAVEVACPDESVGDVIGDLNARRGKIAGIEARTGVQVIACLVPLAEMFGYATDIRSRTQGRATFSMEFKRYAQVPSGIREVVVARKAGA